MVSWVQAMLERMAALYFFGATPRFVTQAIHTDKQRENGVTVIDSHAAIEPAQYC